MSEAQTAVSSAPADTTSDEATSVERIVTALYATISRPAGVAPDWERFRTLFAPGARLMPTNRGGEDGRVMRVHDVEDYIRSYGAMLEAEAIDERQVASRLERFGAIAHLWSTYELRRGDEPVTGGINSIQLYHDGARWWVVSVFWDSERPDNPIPEHYLASRDA
jgi:hypothetical protein